MPDKVIKTKLQSTFEFEGVWEDLLDNKDFIKVFLSEVLEDYIVKQRWYGGKASKLKYIELSEYFRIQKHGEVYFGLLLEIDFVEAFFHHYFLPIAFVTDASFAKSDRILPIKIQGQQGYVIDALNLEAFRKLVFERILGAATFDRTKVQYHRSESFKDVVYESSRFMGLEQSNTSIIYNDQYVLKFFRRIFADKNPDYEMSRFLSEIKDFKNTPSYQGSVNIIDSEDVNVTIALMQKLVPNEGDAWDYMLKELHGVFLNLDAKKISLDTLKTFDMFERLQINEVCPEIIDWVGLNLLVKIKQLAVRTAEMHIVLGSEFEDTAFTPNHFNGDYEVWLKNRLLYQFQNLLNIIENQIHKMEVMAFDLAREFLEKKNIKKKRITNNDYNK